MKTIYALFLFTALFWSCNLDDLHEPLETDTCSINVSFDFSPIGNCKAPCETAFTANAADAISYDWDFGDGSTSTLPNPNHTFMEQGDYQVFLTVDNGSCTKMSDRVVTVSTTTFEKTIQQGGAFDLLSVTKVTIANDGGYIVVGRRKLESIGDYGFWYKVDITGSFEDLHFIGCCFQFNAETSGLSDVIAIPGTGYVVCGSLTSGFTDIPTSFVAQLDEEGQEIWSYLGVDNSSATDVLPTADGGYLISGGFGISPNEKGYLLKLNAAGQEEWSKTNINVDLLESVHQHTDGSLVAFGYNFNTNAKIFTLNNLGNITSTLDIPGTFSSSPARMKIAEDGGYLILTTLLTSVFTDSKLYKFNRAGTLEWSEEFDNVFLSEAISHADGTYAVCGTTRPLDFSIRSDAYLAQLDAAGQVNWEEEIGGMESDGGHAFHQTADGGYFIAGTDESISKMDAVTGDKGVYLIKTDAEGKVD